MRICHPGCLYRHYSPDHPLPDLCHRHIGVVKIYANEEQLSRNIGYVTGTHSICRLEQASKETQLPAPIAHGQRRRSFKRSLIVQKYVFELGRSAALTVCYGNILHDPVLIGEYAAETFGVVRTL